MISLSASLCTGPGCGNVGAGGNFGGAPGLVAREVAGLGSACVNGSMAPGCSETSSAADVSGWAFASTSCRTMSKFPSRALRPSGVSPSALAVFAVAAACKSSLTMRRWPWMMAKCKAVEWPTLDTASMSADSLRRRRTRPALPCTAASCNAVKPWLSRAAFTSAPASAMPWALNESPSCMAAINVKADAYDFSPPSSMQLSTFASPP
mmetsp:Transcript_20620/g.57392  ORF Transcript_20620/g.57392 Transcript_20620/m.57392 type:complete len:208 (-) Transcript_20620:586-1209(-)